MPDAFRVVTFTPETLSEEVKHGTCTDADVRQNRRVQYLKDYLLAIGVRTIVTELEYVDADYLDDYANFYAKSFEAIPNRCRRLHFFTDAIDAASLEAVMLGDASPAGMQTAYAGFMVARPLPTAIVGRTVLKTYPDDGGRRHYSAVRDYSVNLFGIPLTLKSLAFQEQDTSLAACATVALWTSFQKAQDLFHTAALTPAAITRAANRLLLAARPFPSRSLQIQQICNAIAAAGLDPEVYEAKADLPLVSLIYSYVKLGLPVLAIVQVGTEGHAIAINGYSLRPTKQIDKEGGNVDQLLPPLIGSRIDEFYGHDDQTGPFRRLKLVGPTATQPLVTFTDTGWPVDLIPYAIVVPVYPKIRTGFREVKEWLPRISAVISWAKKPDETEWDVYLTSSNDFKASLRTDPGTLDPALRQELLTTGFPKYLWRCMLRIAGVPVIEMVLDTTAMVKGFPIRNLWWHDQALKAQIMPFIQNATLAATIEAMLGERLFKLLKES